MTDLLEDLTIRPEMQLEGLATGDLLSQVLAQIRLTGDRVYSTTQALGQRLKLDEKARTSASCNRDNCTLKALTGRSRRSNRATSCCCPTTRHR